MVDPDDDTPIGNVYKKKSFLTAATTVPLFDLMDRFQTGKSKEYRFTFKQLVSRHVSRHLRETPMQLKMLITEKMYKAIKLRTVPTIVIAHTICASPDTRISYRQCILIQGYFCAV